jgi:hypothetical protein
MRLDRFSICIAAIGTLALAGACSQETQDDAATTAVSAGKDVEEAAKTARDNVENAAETNTAAYDEKRKEGEGRLEAAGDAYNAVEAEAK